VTTLARSAEPANTPAGYDPEEWRLRVQLAACYRLFDYLGWTEMIFNHITMRVPGPGHHFLINPFGLHYSEVTASNLVRIALDGKIAGRSDYPVNPAGFVIHSAIHAAVPEARCIMHTHTTAGMAVACSKRGLDPTTRSGAFIMHLVGYHDFEGPSVHDGEKPRLVRDLGERRALILRNHGLLATGPTIPDAFILMKLLQRACEVQLATSTIDEGIVIPAAIRARSRLTLDTPNNTLENPESPSARKIYEAMIRLVEHTDPPYWS
jgi:ribulose-5-phosphate 4-epimerase/fuculose-1-phosphate aldolase